MLFLVKADSGAIGGALSHDQNQISSKGIEVRAYFLFWNKIF